MRYRATLTVDLDEASRELARATARKIAAQICDSSFTDCVHVEHVVRMVEKIPCYRLSPELVDGVSRRPIPCGSPGAHEAVLAAVRTWLEEDLPVGETASIEVVEMTQEELDALPEL